MKTNNSFPLYFNLQIDCESTQFALQNPALGERAIRGLGDVLAETKTLGTFLVIPGDIEAHLNIYRDLEKQGHEIGLHYHPSEKNRSEFLGSESPDIQRRVLREAMDRFAQATGRLPLGFCPGYGSANDYTYGILEELGLKHGLVSFPTRNLPQCACVWGNSPLDPHYPHRYNKSLEGDAHPQDLRVELVDAKNHFYTVEKAVRRQNAAATPLRQIHAVTHNTFEFDDPANFRRETYRGIVEATRRIAEREQMVFTPTTLEKLAAEFRRLRPLVPGTVSELKLDVRGRAFNRVAA
jgi:hypothetical protein